MAAMWGSCASTSTQRTGLIIVGMVTHVKGTFTIAFGATCPKRSISGPQRVGLEHARRPMALAHLRCAAHDHVEHLLLVVQLADLHARQHDLGHAPQIARRQPENRCSFGLEVDLDLRNQRLVLHVQVVDACDAREPISDIVGLELELLEVGSIDPHDDGAAGAAQHLLDAFAQILVDDFGTAMRVGVLRFWTVEHAAAMILALGTAHVGRARIKRTLDARARHRIALVSFAVALVAILAGIPWPGTVDTRPLFRF